MLNDYTNYNLSLKINFTKFHIDFFLKNVGNYSEEKGEVFFRDIEIEIRSLQR